MSTNLRIPAGPIPSKTAQKVIGLLLVAGFAMTLGGPAHAVPEYEGIPPESMCAKLLNGTPFAPTEKMRTENYARLLQYKKDIQTQIDQLTEQFFDKMKSRRRTSKDLALNEAGLLLMQHMGLSPTTESERIPGLSLKTFNAFHAVENPPEGISHRGELWQKAFEAFEADPYIQWLKLNVDAYLKLGLIPGSHEVTTTGLKPIRNSTDPLKLLQSTLYISGPSYLPFKLSMIRVYRDLDPELTPQQRNLAHKILMLAKGSQIIHWQMSHMLDNANRQAYPNYPTTFDLVPDLASAKANLKSLQEDSVQSYGTIFPKLSFEIFLERMNGFGDTSIFAVVREINSKRLRNGQNMNEELIRPYKQELEKLRRSLKLPAGYDFVKHWSPFDRAPKDAYALFLLRNFGESQVFDLVIGLQQLIPVLELIADDVGFAKHMAELMLTTDYGY